MQKLEICTIKWPTKVKFSLKNRNVKELLNDRIVFNNLVTKA